MKNVGASKVVLVVKNLPANAGDIRDMGLIPGSERTHTSILAWRILRPEEPGGPGRLQSMGSQRVEHDWVTKHAHKVLSLYKQVLEMILRESETRTCTFTHSENERSLTNPIRKFISCIIGSITMGLEKITAVLTRLTL